MQTGKGSWDSYCVNGYCLPKKSSPFSSFLSKSDVSAWFRRRTNAVERICAYFWLSQYKNWLLDIQQVKSVFFYIFDRRLFLSWGRRCLIYKFARCRAWGPIFYLKRTSAWLRPAMSHTPAIQPDWIRVHQPPANLLTWRRLANQARLTRTETKHRLVAMWSMGTFRPSLDQ